jgi:GR25 family glycosyltransferase involved in LPS biosynthesis
MRVTYINLDRETGRRTGLEANFAAHNQHGWTLSRFSALDAAALDAQGIQTTLRPSEAACFLSHRGAIEQSLVWPGNAMILEDDCQFGASTQQLVVDAIRNMPRDWDLLYTDICVPNFQAMIELFLLRRQRASRASLIPLRGMPFAGATAYVINEKSKPVLAELFAQCDLDIPYDLWLRQLVYDGVLTAFATFPFATTLSPEAETSQIQGADQASINAVWNGFRRMMWYQADTNRRHASFSDIDFASMASDELELVRMLAGVIAGKSGVGWIAGLSPQSRRT